MFIYHAYPCNQNLYKNDIYTPHYLVTSEGGVPYHKKFMICVVYLVVLITDSISLPHLCECDQVLGVSHTI